MLEYLLNPVVGELVNLRDAVYLVESLTGRDYEYLRGGRGVKEATLRKIADGTWTRGEKQRWLDRGVTASVG